MALGRLWFKVPPTIRVEFEGKMPKWLRGKDLILRLIGDIGVDGALYKALEFGGETLSELDVEARLCISNMAIEAGGKCGLFPSDEKTLAYCRDHNSPDAKLIAPDARPSGSRRLRARPSPCAGTARTTAIWCSTALPNCWPRSIPPPRS